MQTMPYDDDALIDEPMATNKHQSGEASGRTTSAAGREEPRGYFLDNCKDRDAAAQALLSGGVVAHAFANFYVITTRADAATVRGINVMKGRPPNQVGSVLTTRHNLDHLFDWSRLPAEIDAGPIRALIDALYQLGPFGFRGPAAIHMPSHMTFTDAGVLTTQVIAPGYQCLCNDMLDDAIGSLPEAYVYVTSANRSRHQTGAEDEPAHFEADGLQAEFGHEPGFFLLRHRDETAARAAYPDYAPMSTTILAFHKLGGVTPDGRPILVAERHGSLPIETLRDIVERHGFGLVAGNGASRRLTQRGSIQADGS